MRPSILCIARPLAKPRDAQRRDVERAYHVARDPNDLREPGSIELLIRNKTREVLANGAPESCTGHSLPAHSIKVVDEFRNEFNQFVERWLPENC